MSATLLNVGEARALTRRLASAPDLLSLYATLSDSGRRADTLFLETLNGPSLILDRAALRIEGRGHGVSVEALSGGGQHVLGVLKRKLEPYLVQQSSIQMEFRFSDPAGDDAEARLLAPSPFDVLRMLTGGMKSATPEEPFTLACPGIVAFDHVDMFEALPPAAADPLDFPDFIFWLAESLVVVEPGLTPRLICTSFGGMSADDSEKSHFAALDRLTALSVRCEAAASSLPANLPPVSNGIGDYQVDLDDAAYGDIVVRLKERICAGDIYQIVPSRTFRAPCADPLKAFAAVRALDPSPYMFFVSMPQHILFGASPESSVRVSREDQWPVVEVKPIAGTRPRGVDADDDDRMEAALRLDSKEIAEHMMLVDLARNDVARISIPGTRRVSGLMTVERYARVMHLVSTVRGCLAVGFDAFHALQACLNVGTLSGAPKLKATELLRLTERTKRGPYGGAVGWVNGAGTMDTGVVIRSAVVKDGIAYVRAGAGVVHDSHPQNEAEETRRKASAILAALTSVGVM